MTFDPKLAAAAADMDLALGAGRVTVDPVCDYTQLRQGVRKLTVPPQGIELPVKGITFRDQQYPTNVDRLRELVWLNDRFGDLNERWWVKRNVKPGQFRDMVEHVFADGKVRCRLELDERNRHDPDAVMVWCPVLADFGFLGYLPAQSHGCMNVAIAQQLRDDPYPAGHPAFSVWVTKIRVHPDHPDRPGISVMVRRWRAAPNSRPRSVAELRRMGY